MRRPWISVIAAALLLLVAMPALSGEKTRATRSLKPEVTAATAKLTQAYTAEELQKGVYVGSDFCLACHKSMASYKSTNHASFVRRPMTQYSLQPGRGVIADYDANKVDDFIQGLDFNKISSGFDKYKPNAPILSVENGTYFVTIGSLKMPVLLTVAGQRNGSAQRFVVKVPVADTANKLSASAYFAPLQYSPNTGWAAYSPTAWYDGTTNAPKFAAGIGSAALVASGGPSNHTSGCTGCHTNAFGSLTKNASGESYFNGYVAVLFNSDDPTVFDYNADGNFELMNIGCEACHGPGSLHILAGGDPTKIVNPKNLKATQQAEICGRCHVTGKSVPTNTFNWPYNDATNTNWTPLDAKAGRPLADFYKDTANYWPDAVHPNGGRPYNQWKISAHATFALHTIGCPECHDPHDEGEGRLLRESIVQSNITIPTSAEDNSLCMGCHAGYGPFNSLKRQDVADMKAGKAEAYDKIAKVTEAHTHHPYAPERMLGLSRCIGCHMAAGNTTPGTTHAFGAVSPEQTLKYQDKGGMYNSCASGCHNNNVNVFMAKGSYLGVKPAATSWNTPFDVTLSNVLKSYYGEGGVWWDTKK